LESFLTQISPSGWTIDNKVRVFNPGDLYEIINGRSEMYLAYDVVNLTFVNFYKPDNPGLSLDVYVYDMGTPLHAFGVFSMERGSDEDWVELGREGYYSRGAYYIWKGRYYIKVAVSERTSELKLVTLEMTNEVVNFLSDDGEEIWGLKSFPPQNLVPQSINYFHVDALGLEFMSQTFTALYCFESECVTAFITRQNSDDSAQEILRKYLEFVGKYGKGHKQIESEITPISLCDMGVNYDAVFSYGNIVAGISAADNPQTALMAAKLLADHVAH
jgi:hypothetical protein